MITSCFPIAGNDFLAAGSASRKLKEQLKLLGIDGQIMRRIMIASFEAELNVVMHAFKGNLWVRLDRDRFNMEVIDKGPGIADTALAMKPGFSTASAQARQLGFGAGMGLPNIQKASDVFEVDSQVGKGTRIRSTIYLKTQPVVHLTTNCLAINAELCNGCLDCLKACPTRAIRVWNQQPHILTALCIECTACIATCRRGVFTIQDADIVEPSPPEFAETIRETLVIPRAFLTQFGLKVPPLVVEAILKSLGFKEIRFTEEWEEELRRDVRRYVAEQDSYPVISPICPAVVHLIESQFPSLLGQIAPYRMPIEAAVEDYALRSATFVAACPGQHTLLRQADPSGRLNILKPAELSARILPLLTTESARNEDTPDVHPPRNRQQDPAILEAWGMEQVVKILEETEKGLAGDFRTLELSGCVYGCYGTPLFEENPFMAKKRWSASRHDRKRRVNTVPVTSPYIARTGMRLDTDMGKAIEKLARIDELSAGFPGRDCGACGSPTCASLAEDIVLERSPASRCVILREGRES
ncbi:MAG: 4Fe-4S binding protein [Spirochaetaceae bacterium]|nr:MAG: 4Fe-4S binding protein [Spirochaetaceae bacterium]